MLAVDQLIEGKIEDIAFGGEGILKYQGFVIFVPFTAIDDQITCQITKVKRSFAYGILISVQKASPSRQAPLCPYFGKCGGCQLQHLHYDAQVQYKAKTVKDAFTRMGHLSFPPLTMVPALTNWAYRRHITLHLKPKNDHFEAGYIGQDNHSLIVIQTCPIFIEADHPILKQLQHFVNQLPNPNFATGRVTLLKNHQNQFILFFQFDDLFKIELELFKLIFSPSSLIAGMIIQTSKDQFVLGNPYSEQYLQDLRFHFSPQTFIQNHLEQSINIYQKICQLADLSASSSILDLYCGFGTVTLLLAKQGHQVIGIEQNKQAIKFAKENALRNHLSNVSFIQNDVEKILPKFLKENQINFIIVNPPRQGLTKKVIQTLIDSKIESFVYVSCMPATLARDLQILCKYYEIDQGSIYDMFPQTAHVETLVYLKKKV